MSVVGCEVLDVVHPGDITTYQEKQLKSRKHTTRRQTDEEKWRDIYQILFPNEDIPSPYPEPAEDLAPTSSEPHVSLNFQHFLLTQMPGLFTSTAEEHAGRHLQAHEGLPMEAIPRIIEDALQKAFRLWQTQGSELPTREASVASMSFMPETPSSVTYTLAQSTSYQPAQAAVSMGQSFPHVNFPTPGFTPDVAHTSHADDSGFADGHFFSSGPPVDFNTFAPQYERSPWEASLSLLGEDLFQVDSNLGAML
ncbi:70b163b4-35a9-473d-9b67-890a8383f933 [Thermothielavioides terrestris]|uniref:70b163b4-35a9-473d-9b67-890a8383f933 n=1 Tax=Thermothielavioides terrestris TaxID=2587410 RepID=A0A446BPU6_9PEZI|nr:70b163b4-35a9-473d-9b67-890a8383f933 [Thermothielavioides terrestris]